MTSGSGARVLCLSPEAVLRPTYERLRPELAPHVLVSAETSGAGIEALLPVADHLMGDWTHGTRLDAGLLGRAGRCLCIFQPTAGVESIDVATAAALGIPVANAPGTNDRAVAEWTVMAILALLKETWRHHQGVLQGRWDMVDAGHHGVYELGGRTVGIVGMGRIGQAVAQRLASFEPGRLRYFDAAPAPPEIARRLALERVELDELCATSDVLTLHVPLAPSTRHLLDARRLGLLPRHAVVVNAARGAVLDERALCAALDAGRLKAAALDVFSHEPLPERHPLRDRPNVLLSPHLAGSTNEARDRMVSSALENLDAVLRGGAPAHVVNGVAGVPRRDVTGDSRI